MPHDEPRATEDLRHEAIHDPYAPWRVPGFRWYLLGSVASVLGMQMQTVAVGWEVFQLTNSSLALGCVGLAQIGPVLLLALHAGHIADHFDRRRILMFTIFSIAACSLGLAQISRQGWGVVPMYICLFASGIARALQQPAKAAFLPQIVPRECFGGAVTWLTGGFQLASVAGPALGGLLIAVFRSPALVYQLDAAFTLFFLAMLLLMKKGSPRQAREERATNSPTSPTLETLVAGVKFVSRTKTLLAAMALDMFAVLLGGATALLPLIAEKILRVGPAELGWMQAAPALGAVAMSLVLAHRPPLERAGRALLWSVVGFGVATIVFGFSRSFWLSMAMLVLTGAFDNISVVVRHTLVQILTPDEMRGRVSAINGVFIGASNELGGFESGVVAEYTTPTISVVAGGIGTIVVVAIVAVLSKGLRTFGRLDGRDSMSSPSNPGNAEASRDDA